MIHIFTDGIMLNPIDSWLVLLIKHGAGWASVLIALIALIKTKRPVQRYYYAYMLNKIDSAIRLANVEPPKGQDFSPFLFMVDDLATKKRNEFLIRKRSRYLQKLMDVL